MNKSSVPAAGSVKRRRGWRPWRFVKGRPWMVTSLAIFVVVVAALLAFGVHLANAVLLGFDLAR